MAMLLFDPKSRNLFLIYDSKYDQEELEELLPKIKEKIKNTDITLIMIDTHIEIDDELEEEIFNAFLKQEYIYTYV